MTSGHQAELDEVIWIIDNLHLLRMDIAATAAHIGVTVETVKAARRYEIEHGRELLAARADRRQRGVVRKLTLPREIEAIASIRALRERMPALPDGESARALATERRFPKPDATPPVSRESHGQGHW